MAERLEPDATQLKRGPFDGSLYFEQLCRYIRYIGDKTYKHKFIT